VNIVYTKHAQKKFEDLAKLGIKVTKILVKQVVTNPQHQAKDPSSEHNTIASRELDRNLVLRVVYRVEDGIILVITFYPSEKGRYF